MNKIKESGAYTSHIFMESDCVCSGCAHVFNLNVGPLSSQNRACFSLWFLPQQPEYNSQQRHVKERKKKKPVMWACKTFCWHTEAETYESGTGSREEDKVFLPERQCIPSRACWQATNHRLPWAEWTGYHNKPADELLIFRPANRSTPHFWSTEFDYGLACFNTAAIIDARHEQLGARLRAASCLKSTIPHPNGQQGARFISIRPFASSTAFRNTNYTFRTWFSHLTWKIKVKISGAKPTGLLH